MSGRPPAVERGEGPVAVLRVATDEHPYLGPGTVEALARAVASIARDTDVRAVVVAGGERHFCAGASREALLGAEVRGETIPFYATELARIVLSIPVPTVAAMAGHAVGGGFVLGLWCDAYRLAEEGLYGANFVALGFTPGMGATVALEEAVGASFARELLLGGRLVKGRDLRGSPLGHTVVPRADVHRRAHALAASLAEGSPAAVRLLKATLARRRRERLDAAARDERAMHEALFGADAAAATRAEIDLRYPGGEGAR